MIDKNMEDKMSFYDLQWDTDYFGVSCAKVILYKPLTLIEWDELKGKFIDYQFISIENRNSEPTNARLICSDTRAFLVDVNIQFKKEIEKDYEMPETIKIYQDMKQDKQIVEMADFKISKFTEDPELIKRGGSNVYKQWLINSFGKADKYFAISTNSSGEIDGFLLHSYSDNSCTVELIAVSNGKKSNGVGTKLFRAIEYAACERGYDEIRVGTQIRNVGAINFYHKVGCKQVGCHQIYHLWRL